MSYIAYPLFVFSFLFFASNAWTQEDKTPITSCQVTFNDQQTTLSIEGFDGFVAALAKSNSCVYGKIANVPKTGIVFRGGVKVKSGLSNSEAKKLIAGDEKYCLSISCDPIEEQSEEPQVLVLRKGDSVVDNSTNQKGTVHEIFADGRTSVLFQDDTSRYYIRHYPHQISKQVDCVGNYCNGTRVVDYSGEWGTIHSIYSNGVAFVLYPSDTSRYYIRKIEIELSIAPHSITEYRGIRLENRVIDNGDNSVGYVKEIFSNGLFKILYDSDTSKYYYRTFDQIRLPPNELQYLNGIQVGDTVIDNADNSIGTVKFIFSNGYYRILFNNDTSRYYDRTIEQITPAVKD